MAVTNSTTLHETKRNQTGNTGNASQQQPQQQQSMAPAETIRTQNTGTGNGPTSGNTGSFYRPEGYSSRFESSLDEALNQLQGYGDFKYEFEGDNLFKAYRDMMTQQGKQASLDSMGQAAALTGGYGNSYGQQVGQQTFNSALTNLYDKGLDLYDTAYTGYQDKYNRLSDNYNNLYNAENEDYNRFADERTFNEDARQFDTSQAESARQFDISSAESARQFELELAETARQYDISLAQSYVTSILENGGMPSEELLAMAGLTKEDAEELRNKENDPQNSSDDSSSSSGGTEDPTTIKASAKETASQGLTGVASGLDTVGSTGTKTSAVTKGAVSGITNAGNATTENTQGYFTWIKNALKNATSNNSSSNNKTTNASDATAGTIGSTNKTGYSQSGKDEVNKNKKENK